MVQEIKRIQRKSKEGKFKWITFIYFIGGMDIGGHRGRDPNKYGWYRLYQFILNFHSENGGVSKEVLKLYKIHHYEWISQAIRGKRRKPDFEKIMWGPGTLVVKKNHDNRGFFGGPLLARITKTPLEDGRKDNGRGGTFNDSPIIKVLLNGA